MLPREEQDEDLNLDESDPRYELIQRLLEYKRYKEMAVKMFISMKKHEKNTHAGILKKIK